MSQWEQLDCSNAIKSLVTPDDDISNSFYNKILPGPIPDNQRSETDVQEQLKQALRLLMPEVEAQTSDRKQASEAAAAPSASVPAATTKKSGKGKAPAAAAAEHTREDDSAATTSSTVSTRSATRARDAT